MTVNSIDTKPVLRISRYQCAMGDGFAEFPLRLARNRTGQYYWAMAWRISLVAAGKLYRRGEKLRFWLRRDPDVPRYTNGR
jgi:hypothetical protein